MSIPISQFIPLPSFPRLEQVEILKVQTWLTQIWCKFYHGSTYTMLFQVLSYSAGMTGNKHILLWQMPRPWERASLSSGTKPSRRLGAGRRAGCGWVMRLLCQWNKPDREKHMLHTPCMCELKKKGWLHRENRMVIARGRGGGMGGVDQRAHSFNWRKCKFWGSNIQYDDWSW